MSTITFDNDIINSVSMSSLQSVDATKIESKLTKIETEWTAGTNTDLSVSAAKVVNLNIANGAANAIGQAVHTTLRGNIANVDDTGRVDTYDLSFTDLTVANNVKNLSIDYTGTITEIIAYYHAYTSGHLDIDIENSGTVVKTGGTYTFETLVGTEATPTVLSSPITGEAATTRKSLSLSIKADDTLIATGLIIKVRITRT